MHFNIVNHPCFTCLPLPPLYENCILSHQGQVPPLICASHILKAQEITGDGLSRFSLEQEFLQRTSTDSSDTNFCLKRLSSSLHRAYSYSSFKIHLKRCFCKRTFPEPLVTYFHSILCSFLTHHIYNYFLHKRPCKQLAP